MGQGTHLGVGCVTQRRTRILRRLVLVVVND
jgi:hypothetical protein